MTSLVVNLYDELPDFANKENRSIHSAILKKNEELKVLKNECSDLQSRVNNLTQHLSSIKNEIGNSQDLLSTQIKHAENEKHLQQLCDREQGKITSEITKLKEQTEYLNSKVDAVQYKTNVSQRRISEFKEESELNEEEMEQWISIARQKEEDFQVLQQYQREDESQIRILLSQIEKATSIIESKKSELDQEITATRALQIELNVTAEHFRKMHEERSRLLSQWEQTLEQMQNLNESIKKTTNNYEQRKSKIVELHSQLTNQEKLLQEAKQSNQELERQSSLKESLIANKAEEYESESLIVSHLKENVENQRHQLEQLEGEIRSFQGEINNYKDRLAQERARKEGYLVRIQGAQAQNRPISDSPAELVELRELLEKQEDELKSFELRADDEKGQILKLTQEIYETRKNEKKMLEEIQQRQNYAKGLSSKVREFDKDLQKQLEQLYATNIQIQQMERKIGSPKEEHSDEEKFQIQAQIEDLEKILSDKHSSSETMDKQLAKLESDLKQAKKKKEELEKVKSDLAVKLNELHIDQESIDKSTAKARSQKENVLVQLNMLKVQVEKLGSQLATKSDKVISENQKQQLQFSLMERISEIDSHLSALRTQLKTEDETRHAAQIELNEMKKQKDILQVKYEKMVGQIGQVETVENPEDKNSELIRPCYIIELAKEREEINQREDQLEEEMKIAIKELRGLEKAMEKLSGQSIKPSKAIEFLNGSGKIDNEEQMSMISKQLEFAKQKLAQKKEEAKNAALARQKTEDLYELQQKMITDIQAEINRLKPVVEKIGYENKEMNNNLKKATSIFTKNKDEHRKKTLNAGPEEISELKYPATQVEMNVEYRILKSVVEDAVDSLFDLIKNNREIEQKVLDGLEKIGIVNRNSPQKAGPNTSAKNVTIVRPKGPAAIASSRSSSALAPHSPILNKRSAPKVPSIQKLHPVTGKQIKPTPRWQ